MLNVSSGSLKQLVLISIDATYITSVPTNKETQNMKYSQMIVIHRG